MPPAKKERSLEFESFKFVRVSERTREILERQLEAFRRKFGRAAGPRDPIFFDPRAVEPRPLDLSRRQ